MIDVEQDHRGHERQGDAEELADGARAIERGRFVQLRRDALEAGQEDQGVLAGAQLGDHDQREFRVGGIPKPVGALQPHGGQDVVDQPVSGVEHHDEDERDRKHGQDRGQIEPRPVEPDLSHLPVHRQRDDHRNDDPDRDGKERVVERVVDRFPELRIVGHPLIVLGSDEDRITQPRVARQAQVERVEDRKDAEGHETEQPRADEQQAEPKVASLDRSQATQAEAADSRQRGAGLTHAFRVQGAGTGIRSPRESDR